MFLVFLCYFDFRVNNYFVKSIIVPQVVIQMVVPLIEKLLTKIG